MNTFHHNDSLGHTEQFELKRN